MEALVACLVLIGSFLLYGAAVLYRYFCRKAEEKRSQEQLKKRYRGDRIQ
jgi:hypothetical protein